MAAKKIRLDRALVERGLASSRDMAKRVILAGEVLVEGQVMDKAGQTVAADAAIELKGPKLPYVGRGGLKLAGALDELGVDVREGSLAIDIGASTGGFTDCLLQRGAGEVIAIDVGRNQLHEKMRRDPRVRVMERTNARYLTLEDVGGKQGSIIVIDVSFISLRLILPVCRELLEEEGDVVALVKPQFEAGKKEVASGGIVRDPGVHLEVLRGLAHFAEAEGWRVCGASISPIRGADGNIEFFLHLKKARRTNDDETVRAVGDEAVRAVGDEAGPGGGDERQETGRRERPDLEALVREAHGLPAEHDFSG